MTIVRDNEKRGGKSFTLGQLSFMRIAPDGRIWWDMHWETGSHHAKILLGRIWFRILLSIFKAIRSP